MSPFTGHCLYSWPKTALASYIVCLFWAVFKYLKRSARGGRASLGSWFERTGHHGGEVTAVGAWGNLHQEPEGDRCWGSTYFLLSVQSRVLVQGLMASTLRAGFFPAQLSLSGNTLVNTPTTLMVLMKINHHTFPFLTFRCYLQFIGQNRITWPCRPAKKAGKFGLHSAQPCFDNSKT